MTVTNKILKAPSNAKGNVHELWDAFSVNGLHVKRYEATYRPLVSPYLGEGVAVRVDVVAEVGVGDMSDWKYGVRRRQIDR